MLCLTRIAGSLSISYLNNRMENQANFGKLGCGPGFQVILESTRTLERITQTNAYGDGFGDNNRFPGNFFPNQKPNSTRKIG